MIVVVEVDETRKQQILNSQSFTEFANNREEIGKQLKILLHDLKKQGARIGAYGAPAKGNTLLNAFQLGIFKYLRTVFFDWFVFSLNQGYKRPCVELTTQRSPLEVYYRIMTLLLIAT